MSEPGRKLELKRSFVLTISEDDFEAFSDILILAESRLRQGVPSFATDSRDDKAAELIRWLQN